MQYHLIGFLIEYSKENGSPLFLGVGKVTLFWALAMKKREDKMILTEMIQAVEQLRSVRFLQIESFCLLLLAEVYAKYGQLEKGLNTIREARSWIAKMGDRYLETEIYRLEGDLLLSQSSDNQQDAGTCFQKAIDVSRSQQAKSFELRASVSLSRLWQREDRKEEARKLLQSVYGGFTEGFDAADLQEARALLDTLA